VYNGAGKVPPAPFKATMGNELVVVVVAGAVVDVTTAVVVDVVEAGWVVVVVGIKVVVGEVVITEVVVGVVVVIAWVVEMGWVVVVVVAALLQAVKPIAVTSNSDVRTMSHFLLNLFNNVLISFFLFSFIIRGYV
jgi:hypothetical protein